MSGEVALLAALARTLRDRGRTLEALEALARAQALAEDPAEIAAEVSDLSALAIAAFNAHKDVGEIDMAETYVAALIQLGPRNPSLLTTAVECNKALGRWNEVAGYARTLVDVDPDSLVGHQVLAEICKVTADAEGEIGHRMALALAPDNPLAPLVRLRDLHDAASLILCRPLTGESEVRLETILAAARHLEIPSEPGSEWADWEAHYRLLLAAVDLAAIRGPTPHASADEGIVYAGPDGRAMKAADVAARADRLKAQVVYYAAADEAYVDLYARWYARSILKFSDVPCLVLIHVIGGAGRLKEIASRVGVADERLVFAGDEFRAVLVTTACQDAPPKGRAAKPLAHLQSARFQRLGGVLDLLARPVFVSDIDLMLQRGVADLLDRCAGDDLVFNENEASLNAGSRLTANLLLARPTPNARLYLAFLARYLDDALAAPAVTRWIDQFGLLIARHHLMRHGDGPRLGYFDTASDVNNVMYPAYQPHPFRFLSLFHGFDMDSLEGVLG